MFSIVFFFLPHSKDGSHAKNQCLSSYLFSRHFLLRVSLDERSLPEYINTESTSIFLKINVFFFSIINGTLKMSQPKAVGTNFLFLPLLTSKAEVASSPMHAQTDGERALHV